MTFEEKIEKYREKLYAKELIKQSQTHALKEACATFISAYEACQNASAKRELATVYGHCKAFVEGVKHAPKNAKEGE